MDIQEEIIKYVIELYFNGYGARESYEQALKEFLGVNDSNGIYRKSK